MRRIVDAHLPARVVHRGDPYLERTVVFERYWEALGDGPLSEHEIGPPEVHACRFVTDLAAPGADRMFGSVRRSIAAVTSRLDQLRALARPLEEAHREPAAQWELREVDMQRRRYALHDAARSREKKDLRSLVRRHGRQEVRLWERWQRPIGQGERQRLFDEELAQLQQEHRRERGDMFETQSLHQKELSRRWDQGEEMQEHVRQVRELTRQKWQFESIRRLCKTIEDYGSLL
jgi:hypothetical protein